MPVVKGGVWTNIEDEILKAAVSKYGLNQWARVSSLLARKTAKQCKARWTEWLDPGIRKIEWSREEDEKLLHLAKLMPTQWRTIAPIVGRTATQCLERYQKLLDEAEARENQELALAGQEGGETAAPSADDVRRLRPGELDPDPESKPARPDTIDLDEDEKEMLSEARARLANTQGKKAKRKARERQLEESRRLAVLQKRRELKNAGINVRVTTRKKGQMDYNADIPFEKAPAAGFFDTQDEQATNERQREAFDPRKQQLANKRKGDVADDLTQDHKRRKNDKDSGPSAGAAAARAAQLQRMREAEQSSKRRALVLPTPQVSEHELEDIVKMGLSGDRANHLADTSDNDATRSLVGGYPTSMMTNATPIRTPRAAPGEDRLATELRNARARTDTQSALLGGDNAVLTEDDASGTTTSGMAPPRHAIATPNPLATPFRNTAGSSTASATPLRTPRDSFHLNSDDPSSALVPRTPRDIRLHAQAAKTSLRRQLASLPRPQQMEFELEAMPEEREEGTSSQGVNGGAGTEEDAAERDKRRAAQAHAAAVADFRRQTRVVRRGLPRPSRLDAAALRARAAGLADPIEREVAEEAARLMIGDVRRFGGGKVSGSSSAQDEEATLGRREFGEEELSRADMEVFLEMGEREGEKKGFGIAFEREWARAHVSGHGSALPGLAGYAEDELDEGQLVTEYFDKLEDRITKVSEEGYGLEKKLAKHHGGYLERQKKLRAKIVEASEALAKTHLEIEVGQVALVAEEAAIAGRLERLRDEVAFVSRREREAQETFRERRDELEAILAR